MWTYSFAIFLFLCSRAYSYYVTVDAGALECYFDRVLKGTKMTLNYEVKGPDGHMIYQENKQSNGKATFTASKDGEYNYCFSNKMSTLAPKTILFELDIEEKHLIDSESSPENEKKLNEMVNDLSSAIHSVKHEMEYMEVRQGLHGKINESTNFRVVLWAAFEFLILFVMSMGQVFYLKRFFEVRRVV